MGIRSTFWRIHPDQLAELLTLGTNEDVRNFVNQLYIQHPFNPNIGIEAKTAIRWGLDKAHDGINQILAAPVPPGRAPVWDVIEGGTALTDTHIGYGPLRYLTSREVTELWHTLHQLSAADLEQRYRLAYAIDDQTLTHKEQYDFEYYSGYLEGLVYFLATAAAANEAVIFYLS